MGFQIGGRLHVIHEAKQITERFRKREFVVEIDDNSRYPQMVMFQLTGDRCEQLDGYQVGEEVKVEFSLRGREWNSPSGEVRYFNSLDVWSLERAGHDSAGFDAMPMNDGAPLPPDPGISEDDIPF